MLEMVGKQQRRQPSRKASNAVVQGEGHSGWPWIFLGPGLAQSCKGGRAEWESSPRTPCRKGLPETWVTRRKIPAS